MALDFRIIFVSSSWGPQENEYLFFLTLADKGTVILLNFYKLFLPGTQRCITCTVDPQQDSCEIPRFTFDLIFLLQNSLFFFPLSSHMFYDLRVDSDFGCIRNYQNLSETENK
jgi:hypothetical protein